jgi:hypothetical protein
MKAQRSTSPTKTYKTTERTLEITLEMLKMKIDPGMSMKTKTTMTKCPTKNTPFTQEKHELPGS